MIRKYKILNCHETTVTLGLIGLLYESRLVNVRAYIRRKFTKCYIESFIDLRW